MEMPEHGKGGSLDSDRRHAGLSSSSMSDLVIGHKLTTWELKNQQ
jgi:hypothetical protein